MARQATLSALHSGKLQKQNNDMNEYEFLKKIIKPQQQNHTFVMSYVLRNKYISCLFSVILFFTTAVETGFFRFLIYSLPVNRPSLPTL